MLLYLFVCLFDFGVFLGYFLGWGELSHVNYVAHSWMGKWNPNWLRKAQTFDYNWHLSKSVSTGTISSTKLMIIIRTQNIYHFIGNLPRKIVIGCDQGRALIYIPCSQQALCICMVQKESLTHRAQQRHLQWESRDKNLRWDNGLYMGQV